MWAGFHPEIHKGVTFLKIRWGSVTARTHDSMPSRGGGGGGGGVCMEVNSRMVASGLVVYYAVANAHLSMQLCNSSFFPQLSVISLLS